MGKLEELADAEGLDVDEMLREASFDGISPGICTEPGCSYTTNVEPDNTTGWCENCEKNTVANALSLAGVI